MLTNPNPENYTLVEWIELQRFSFEDEAQWVNIISFVSGTPPDIVMEYDKGTLEMFILHILSTMNLREPRELPDFKSLKFGEFVDLDCLIALGIEGNISAMLEVLGVKEDKASKAIWVIENYVKWRTTIYRKYASLFGLRDKDFERYQDDEDDSDPLDVARGWYQIIVDLANNDILKIDEVTEQPLEKTLTFLNLKKEKALKEAEEARKIRNRR